jgi:predicted alpha/beta-fold hydrolase
MQSLSIVPCKPPTWAHGGHRQTLFGFFLPSEKLGNMGRTIKIPLPDGDALVGHYFDGSSNFILVAFHGLTGSAESIYMQMAAIEALKLNHSVLLVNHRGCGQGKGLAKNPYHSGRGEDVSEVIAFLRKTYPRKKLIAVGFSLGANALLTLLTKIRGELQPDFALSFNAPVDLSACSEKLKLGFNQLYNYEFVRRCKQDIKFRKLLSNQEFKFPVFTRLHHIDNIYTAPAGGFKSAEDYYKKCSTYNSFHKIEIPTILITAKDDPFITWEPYLKAQGNSNILLHIENHGGHLGYLTQQKNSVRPKRWLSAAVKSSLELFTQKV